MVTRGALTDQAGYDAAGMSEESSPVAMGDVVAGKYRVDHVLGAGGMGIVVAAMQLELDRRVAIKFLLRAVAKNEEVVARFSREARAAARMQGEHVARVLDVGALPDGLPYMVMEHLEGSDLAERISVQRGMPLEEIARIVIEACDALAEAHAAGIVHRDLKPANLFLARQPDRTTTVKLLDFGISKAPTGSAGITSTQAVIGSPVYMSPEQLVSAKNVDHRSDIWSLGVVLFEALAGVPPFNAESMPQIVTRILHTPAPRMLETRPDLPPQVDQLVAACLEKDPAARPQNVAQLAAGLAQYTPDGARLVERIARVLGHDVPARSQNVMPSGPPPGMQLPPPPAPTRSDVDAWGRTQTLPRRSALPWVVASVLGACALIGVAAAVVLTRTRHPLPLWSPTTGAVQAPGTAAAAVTLTPSPEPPSSVLTAATSEPPATPATTFAPHGHAPHGRPGATATAVASAAPPPATTAAPPPAATTAEPSDPLHMGLK
jgi:eukaryotic-like serine/threonine-protein kinase